MKQILVVIIACLSFGASFAQFNLNNYKYVIVEKQFHFQNEANEHDLNRMARFLFRKYGFTAIIDGETLPDDLKGNYCLALKSEIQAKGALRTKATIRLRDCDNNEVFVSDEGITREKDFAKAYQISMREAFKSLERVNYKYVENQEIIDKGKGGEENVDVSDEAKKEIEDLKAELKELKEKKEEVKSEIEDDQKIKAVIETENGKTKVTIKPKRIISDGNFYSVDPYLNGFKFINKRNSQEYIFLKTSVNYVYMTKLNDLTGVGFFDEKAKEYIFEYNDANGERIVKTFKVTQ